MNRRLSLAALACAAVFLFPGCDLFGGGDGDSDLFEDPSNSQIDDQQDLYSCDVEATDGGSISGSLSGSDCTLNDDSSVDYYAFRLTERAVVEIEMESDDFDAFLLLNDDDGTELARNDDASDSTTDSRIELTLNAGLYVIKANSLSAGETGSYTVRLSGDADDDDDDRGVAL